MRLRARGFLLFSFAFSSALTFIDTLEIPQPVKNEKFTIESTATASNSTESETLKNLKTPDVNHGLDKRSAEVFSQEEDKNEEFFNPNNPDKRARLGFTGMRGKKEFSPDTFCAKRMRTRLEGSLNKRFLRNFNELLGGKRASLAFHGMRGKKSQDYENEILDSDASYDSFLPHQELLINSGLMDEPMENSEFEEERKTENESPEEEGFNKRSPYAFQGTRGKKENGFDLKRAMGFLGMRGKKATEVWSSDGSFKRAPQTSFFGMKGKKAQSSGFFGMRGKKASPNAFFGIKGKREPLGYDLQDVSVLNQMKEESGSPRNRYRRGISWLNNSKKAKNAFFGIRGKKSTQERPESSFSSFF